MSNLVPPSEVMCSQVSKVKAKQTSDAKQDQQKMFSDSSCDGNGYQGVFQQSKILHFKNRCFSFFMHRLRKRSSFPREREY